MRQLYLVCEGRRDSIDVKLLDAVLADHLRLPVLIEPAGGSKNPRAIRSWIKDRDPTDAPLLILDRNYDELPPIEAAWNDPTGHTFQWTVHEIENFLLEPWLLHEAFNGFRATVSRPWVGLLPANEVEIDRILQAEAAKMRVDHIGCLLCETCRRRGRALRGTEINRPRRRDLPPLVTGPAAWQEAIRNQITAFQTACGVASSDALLHPGNVAAAWAAIEADVMDPAFLTSGLFRRELAGDLLFSLLYQHLHQRCRYPGTMEDFTTALVETVQRVYDTRDGYRFLDFDRLADRLRAAVPP